MSNSQVHAAVLRFLLQNGYRETQEAFVREAGDLIDFDSVEDAPPLHRLFTRNNNDEDQQLADRMTTSLRFERPEELDEGDNDYYTTLTDTLSDIHTTNVLAVAVEPQTKMIATSSTDKYVKLTNLKDRNTERTYRHHQAPVLSIDFHPITPHFMLTTSMDGTSVLVDTRVHADGSSDPTTGVHQRFKDHQKYVVRGIFSKDGQYIATASYDRSICIYAQREERYELVRKLDNFIGNVETICFLPNHVLVAGVTGDNYIHYIDIDNDFARERYNMNANADDWVSFSPMWISPSPDGKYLLCSTSHQSGRTILFATHDSRQIQNYYDAPTDNQFVTRRHCWHPSGRYFYASGGDDNNIRVIETKTGRVAARLAGHNAMVRTMTLDPQIGLVTGGYDHLVNVWSKPIQSIIR